MGLKDINLDIKRGEIFVIMGLSGSGKSTLIRHFNRIIEPTQGKILVDGEDVLELDTQALRDFPTQENVDGVSALWSDATSQGDR